MMLEDFEDATLQLLKNTASTLNTAVAESSLLEAFNDEEVQNNVITYLRVCTKRRADQGIIGAR